MQVFKYIYFFPKLHFALPWNRPLPPWLCKHFRIVQHCHNRYCHRCKGGNKFGNYDKGPFDILQICQICMSCLALSNLAPVLSLTPTWYYQLSLLFSTFLVDLCSELPPQVSFERVWDCDRASWAHLASVVCVHWGALYYLVYFCCTPFIYFSRICLLPLFHNIIYNLEVVFFLYL